AAVGVRAAVINVSTLKPLDVETIVAHARRTGVVVTAENHSIVGGLGSATAEALLEAGVPARFERVGVQDTFAEGGSTRYLFEKYRLSAHAIHSAVMRLRGTRP
ncbi:MAG TPA: transketolase C-terminal domain-containing protein, partial [Casimicrobiaceae bacterium]|nr:transketolase C-terminal domain-containing protein [Casimicrobiaceae bacterium]